MISASPAQNRARPPRHNSHAMTAHAATAISAKSHRCQPSAPARKLNAAPRLNASTRLANDVSGRSSPGRNDARIGRLVAWSATITASESHSQRRLAGRGVRRSNLALTVRRAHERARFAGADQVHDAPAAKARVRAFDPDVAAPMPASLALAVRARRYRDRGRVPAPHAGRRSDQYEAQVVAERRERVVRIEVGHD